MVEVNLLMLMNACLQWITCPQYMIALTLCSPPSFEPNILNDVTATPTHNHFHLPRWSPPQSSTRWRGRRWLHRPGQSSHRWWHTGSVSLCGMSKKGWLLQWLGTPQGACAQPHNSLRTQYTREFHKQHVHNHTPVVFKNPVYKGTPQAAQHRNTNNMNTTYKQVFCSCLGLTSFHNHLCTNNLDNSAW